MKNVRFFLMIITVSFACLKADHSKVNVPVTQKEALKEVLRFLNITDKAEVSAVNKEQENAVTECLDEKNSQGWFHRCFGRWFEPFSEQESQAFASSDFGFLRQKMKEKGFETNLQKKSDNEIGVVALLNVAFQWKEKAEESTIFKKGQQFPAIRLKAEKHGCKFFEVLGHPHPIISVESRSKDRIYFTRAGNVPSEDKDMQKKISEIRSLERFETEVYHSCVVPMVDLHIEKKVEWLLGLQFKDFCLSEVVQQTKFKMDETGVSLQDFVCARVVLISKYKEYTLEDSFFVWIEREGVSEPYFVGYITPEHWKRPNAQ